MYLLHDPEVVHEDQINSLLDDAEERHKIAFRYALAAGELLCDVLIAFERIEESLNPILAQNQRAFWRSGSCLP